MAFENGFSGRRRLIARVNKHFGFLFSALAVMYATGYADNDEMFADVRSGGFWQGAKWDQGDAARIF